MLMRSFEIRRSSGNYSRRLGALECYLSSSTIGDFGRLREAVWRAGSPKFPPVEATEPAVRIYL